MHEWVLKNVVQKQTNCRSTQSTLDGHTDFMLALNLAPGKLMSHDHLQLFANYQIKVKVVSKDVMPNKSVTLRLSYLHERIEFSNTVFR